jgi:CRISPR/Cas system-associated exonuclease Cas4 (RecB family)
MNLTNEPAFEKLPEKFQFSQGSLQAFVDCRRLFQLRYLDRVTWPAFEVEPSLETERYLELGTDFHQLIQQYYVGIDPRRLKQMAMRDSVLFHWWTNFINHKPDTHGYKSEVEISLSIPIDRFRLTAKFDLLIYTTFSPQDSSDARPNTSRQGTIQDNAATIVDWKTTRKMPKRKWLADRLQTRVYPFVLAKAGEFLQGHKPFTPDQIQMIYWFSNFPETPVIFQYSQSKFDEDESYLAALINEIKLLGGKEAPKTDNLTRCRYCVYRSLCDRGEKAGLLKDLQAEIVDQNGIVSTQWDFDIDQIAEIEF